MSNTKWLEGKWGVFVHYLQGQNNPPLPWNEHVACLDVKKLAEQLHEVGAHYFCITTQQGKSPMTVPTKRYEEITGYKTGEMTPERDFVPELYEELQKYGIDLMLYCTGDGPWLDDKAGKAFGYRCENHEIPVTTEFVRKWAEVLEEMSVRYGKMVKGWWMDGCHPCIDYDEEKWTIFKDAIKKGNPEAVVAFNASIVDRVKSFSPQDDYVAGERSWFDQIPDDSNYIDGGKLWHIFTYMGYNKENFGVHNGWGQKGCRFTPEYLYDFVKAATDKGGMVTIDINMDRYGNFDTEQLKTVKVLKNI